MADIAHVFGQDLQIGPTGDLAVASADLLVQQRILHRLLTNPGDYIWNLSYGAGLGAYVGQPAKMQNVVAIIRQQLAFEATVAKSPIPIITSRADALGNLAVMIRYTDAATGQTRLLTFPVGA